MSIVTSAGCPWAATSESQGPGWWLQLQSPASGTGNGTVTFKVTSLGALLPTPRTGKITIAGQTVTVTQTETRTSTVSGRVTSSLNRGPVGGATVAVGNLTATTAPDGTYSIANVPFGLHRAVVSAPQFVTIVVVNLLIGFEPPFNPVLNPAPPSNP